MNPEAQFQEAVALHRQGKLAEAEALYRQVMAAAPDSYVVRYMLAWMCFKQNRNAEAFVLVEEALKRNPRAPDALTLKGVLLQGERRSDEALQCLDAAIAAKPDDVHAWYNRGFVLLTLGRLEEALAALDRALALNPGHADAWLKRGIVLYELKRSPEARESFGKSLALNPGQPEALFRRGVASWVDRKDYEAAAADFDAALRLEPDFPYAAGWLVQVRQNVCDWRQFDADVVRLDDGVRAGKVVTQPFIYQALSQASADLQACSRLYARDRFPAQPPLLTPAALAARRGHAGKLRIGYVSGEFRDQATAHLMAGLYERHDREKFTVIAFDNGRNDESAMRRRLEVAFAKFVDISRLSGAAAAQAVAAEEIDILVSLNGYFGEQRMEIFAGRPAPLAVNYLGFPATLGAEYVDYLIADRIVIPEGERKFYDEAIVYLPDCYQVNDSGRGEPQAGLSRAQCGLPERGFVFCNFNASYKLTPDAFSGWMRILARVPDSVLWLLECHPRQAENLRKQAEAQGIAANRILFAPLIAHDAHMARLTLADLCLDSLPYNAHTTGSDCLWAGVPLVTCRGTAFAGRVAASLLNAIGLPELVCETAQDYESLAVALARDVAKLEAIREKLKQNRLTAPLFDTARYTRNLEAAYLRMWERFRQGDPPLGFDV